MQQNNDPKKPLIKPGDKVKTIYHRGAEDVVRTVTKIAWASQLNTWRIFTDGGQACECCGRPLNINAKPIHGLPDDRWPDKKWFNLVTETCPYCGSDNVGDSPASWINSLHFPDAPDMFECGDCKNAWEVWPDENV